MILWFLIGFFLFTVIAVEPVRRLVGRAALAASLSGLLGIILGKLLATDPHDSAATALVIAGLLFFPIVWASRRAGTAQVDQPATAAEPSTTRESRLEPGARVSSRGKLQLRDRFNFRAWQRGGRTEGDERLAAAWRALAHEADWAQSRIAVAKASCERFLSLADQGVPTPEAAGLAVRIRKRVPELIDALLARSASATASERRALAEDAVEAVERIGAEADRLRARLFKAATGHFDTLRRHVGRRGSDDPLSPP